MQTTGNLGLKKPEGTDIVDIADLNGNMDILDNAVNGKVDKVTGKQLSTNDYTAVEKTKLAGIAAGANNYTHPNHTGDVTSTGDGITAIAAGVIVNADVNAAAGIDASKIGTGVVSNAEFGYLDGVTSGIQGQLNGKAPLVTTPQQTTGNINYYVRTDGNDSNNGLSNTIVGAFKTIGKAVSMIPQVINHEVIINVGAGTYTEEILFLGYSGAGNIIILGSTNLDTTRKITGRVAGQRCGCRIEFQGLNLTDVSSMAAAYTSCVEVYMYKCLLSGQNSSGYGIYGQNSNIFANECSILGRNIAVYAHYGTEILAMNCTGSANRSAYQAGYGGNIQVTGSVIGSTSTADVNDGGKVTIGSMGTVNPWGDNTVAHRSRCEAVSIAPAQVIAGSTFTKIQFGAKNYDAFGEYDISLSRFTAKTPGIYLVSVTVPIAGLPALARTLLDLQKNGANAWRLQDLTSSVLSDASITGTTSMYLNAGDYLEIFAYIGGYNVNTVPSLGRLNIVRIA